ncbi:MAG: AI-2E family transporter, partial [Vampirovibrio sp.]|nr:AI-2E family transporter [Vampirovibrio sp.]
MKSVKINLIIFFALVLIYGAFILIGTFTELFGLLSGVLIFTYLMLGPIKFLEKLLAQIPIGRRTMTAIYTAVGQLPVTSRPQQITRTALRKFAQGFRRLPLFHPRVVSMLVVYCLTGLLLLLAAAQVLPVLSRQIRSFSQDLPRYVSQVEVQVQNLSQKLNLDFWTLSVDQNTGEASLQLDAQIESDTTPPPEVFLLLPAAEKPDVPVAPHGRNRLDPGKETDLSKTAVEELFTFLQQSVNQLFGNLFKVATTSLTGLVYLLTGLVLNFYLLLDGAAMRRGLIRLLPAKSRAEVDHYLTDVHQFFYQFIWEQLILCLVVGLFLHLTFTAFNLNYAGFLSFFLAACAMIPVLGVWIGLIPAALVILFSQSTLAASALFFIIL